MGHTKGELQIKITIDEMYVYHWNNGEKFLIEAFHRPNTKEQAIINHLALCWNSHDALLDACEAWERAIKHGDLKTIDLGTEMLAGEAIEKTKAAIAAAK